MAFGVFDKDKSGAISAEEFRSVMAVYGQGMSKQEVEEIIRYVDADKDGEVSVCTVADILLMCSRSTFQSL